MSHIILAGHVASKDAAITEVSSYMNAGSIEQKGSIEQFIIENSANFSVKEYSHKLATNELLSNPDTATDPEVLLEVQKSILDYGLQMSLASALTRKAIGAVEGLLRG